MDLVVSSFLRQHGNEILRSWETAVVSEARDVALVGLALRDHVPALLDALAHWLEGGESPESSRVTAEASRHVMQRLDQGVSLAQVFREYRILRETIIATVLQAEAHEQERTGAAGDAGRITRIKGLARLNAGLDVVLSQSVLEFVAERDRRAAAERERAGSALAESERVHRELFEFMIEAYCVIEMIFDERGRAVDFRYLETNPAFVRHATREMKGMRIKEVVPDFEQFWLDQYGRVATTGEPVRLEQIVAGLGNQWFRTSAFRLGGEGSRRVAVLFENITDRKLADDVLRESEGRYRTLFESMDEGFFVIDVKFDDHDRPVDMLYVEANAAATRMVGRDYTGKRLREIDPGYEEYWYETFGKVALTGESVRMEQYAEPDEKWWSFYVFRIGGPESRRVGNIFQDITERKRVEEALRQSDRRKSEFLAVLSHELRNPLAPIRNSVYLLERAAPGSEPATRAREVVRRQTEHLTRLVDDLLDVTRISHGKIPLQRSRVDLREIVRKTTDDLYSVFAQAGVHLRVDTAAPMWVQADATRMAQVLTNLLNNSLKFTPNGGSVRVSAAASGGRAEVSVADDGIGIDPKDIDHMFEPFAQAEQSLARTKGGLGLGLALVKSIVELHGGTVAAGSGGIGRGAEFLVRLPLVEAGRESEEPRDVDTGAVPKSILVIEDNVDGAQSLADILEMHGHRVRVARDGRSGITLARELRPDVVLCDIGLPDVSGYDVARALRSDGPLRDARLVAVSGYAQPEDRQRARDAGFDAHLAKPVELEELLAVLATG